MQRCIVSGNSGAFKCRESLQISQTIPWIPSKQIGIPMGTSVLSLVREIGFFGPAIGIQFRDAGFPP